MPLQVLQSARHWAALGKLSTAVASIVLSMPQVVYAQGPAFIPGDAFFIFLLNERLVDALPEKGGSIELPYHVAMAPFGDLYTGFGHLRIDGVTPRFVQNLRRAYRDHRLHFPKIVREGGTEMNPPIGFVYNRDVDWSSQRIALKYNEDWPHLPAEAFVGPGRDLLDKDRSSGGSFYLPLIKTYDAVVDDWGNARRYKPLTVQVPKNVAWGKHGKLVKEPVIAQSKNVQIVVTTEEDLEVYFRQLPLPDGPTFYQVLPDELNVCCWELADSGEKTFIKEELGKDELSHSIRSDRKPPTLYYGMVRENRKNGDITIPVWPDCRVPLGVPASYY